MLNWLSGILLVRISSFMHCVVCVHVHVCRFLSREGKPGKMFRRGKPMFREIEGGRRLELKLFK